MPATRPTLRVFALLIAIATMAFSRPGEVARAILMPPSTYISVGDITVGEGDTATTVAVPLSWNVTTSTLGGRLDCTLTVIPQGTATTADFPAQSQTFSLSGGGSGTRNVQVVGDLNREPSRVAHVRVSCTATNFSGTSTGVLTLPDDDHPTLTVSDPEFPIPEGFSAEHTLRLSKGINQTTSVRVRTTDGTARAGSDYAAVDRVIVFAAGRTLATVQVVALSDNLIEMQAQETYSLVANAVTPGDLADGGDLWAVGRIEDADMGNNQVTIAIFQPATAPVAQAGNIGASCPDSIAALEPFPFTSSFRDVTIRMTLDRAVTVPFEFNLHTTINTGSGANATSGTDFSSFNSTRTFPAGRTMTFTIRIWADSQVEGDEFFEVVGQGGQVISDAQACPQNQNGANATVKIVANVS